MKPNTNLPAGTLVQISPFSTAMPAVAGSFLVVLSADDWGVKGYVQGIGWDNRGPGPQCRSDAKWDDVEVVGQVPWISNDIDLYRQGRDPAEYFVAVKPGLE